jgi:hypothetical protein
MTRIHWGSPGSRIYETGVDRGVFYPNVGPGLPWSGLVNVTENATVEPARSYVDGVPYRTQKTRASFAAVLQAFFSPREFEEYDGSYGQQRRKAFGLSYRTLIGNDISADHGYLIHLVYNALAEPSPVNNPTLSKDGLDASPFSWKLSTKPVPIPGAKPAAHLIIDSTIANPAALMALEIILYGSDTTEPRMPTVDELLALFEQFATLVIVDHGDGTWSAIGPDEIVYMLDDTSFAIDWVSAVYLDADTYQVRTF